MPSPLFPSGLITPGPRPCLSCHVRGPLPAFMPSPALFCLVPSPSRALATCNRDPWLSVLTSHVHAHAACVRLPACVCPSVRSPSSASSTWTPFVGGATSIRHVGSEDGLSCGLSSRRRLSCCCRSYVLSVLGGSPWVVLSTEPSRLSCDQHSFIGGSRGVHF